MSTLPLSLQSVSLQFVLFFFTISCGNQIYNFLEPNLTATIETKVNWITHLTGLLEVMIYDIHLQRFNFAK